MSFKNKEIEEFNKELSSKAPAPGGGGATAICASMAASLGCMVCNLTIGKKKFLEYDEKLKLTLNELESLREDFMHLADKDAQAFLPLSQAYKIPSDDPNREEIMEKALIAAAGAPLEVMEKSCRCIEIFEYLLDHSSAMVISDVGVGADMAASALKSAGLNVFINTKSMADRMNAERMDRKAEDMLKKYLPMAEEIFSGVSEKLR